MCSPKALDTCGLHRVASAAAILCAVLITTSVPAQLLPDSSQRVSPPFLAEAGLAFGESVVWLDHDGDGFADLAVGSQDGGGKVDVYRGGEEGFTHFTRYSVFSPPVLAACDFDVDGRDDLAIGLDGEVVIFRGVLTPSSSRIAVKGISSEFFHAADWGETEAPGDLFGASLAAGDFNGDGFCDLAIGAPGKTVGAAAGAGMVFVVYADPSETGLGLSFQTLTQESMGTDSSEAGDGFGGALAAGQFLNPTGEPPTAGDDLAIAAPGEGLQVHNGGFARAGAVWIVLSGDAGLSPSGTPSWLEVDFPTGAVGTDHSFGTSLTGGDFDDDGFDELAIGAPGTGAGAGRVYVIMDPDGNGGVQQTWHQDVLGVPGTGDPFDAFGEALTVGNFDGDQYQDLVVGIPGKDGAAGAILVLYGARGGLTAVGNQFLEQVDIGEIPESNDRFGSVLAVGDRLGNGADDLALGVPDEDIGSPILGADVGAVRVVPSPGRLVRVRLAAIEGESLPPPGSLLTAGSLRNPRSSNLGQLAFAGTASSSQFALVEARSFTSGGGPYRIDVADDGSSILLDTGSGSLTDSRGLQVQDGDTVPGVPNRTILGITSVAMTGSGGGYFQAALKDTTGPSFEAACVESLTGTAGDLSVLVKSGDLVGGLPLALTLEVSFLQISDQDHHWILRGGVFDPGPAAVPALVVDGQLAALQEDLLPALGTFIADFGLATIRSDGRYLFSGVDSNGRSFVLADTGVGIATGDALDGFDLGDGPGVVGLGMNDSGHVGVMWESFSRRTLLFGCSADALDTARPVLAEGSRVDLDGDGIGDATILSLADALAGVELSGQNHRPTIDGDIAVLASLVRDERLFAKRAILQVHTGGCPFFSDGFEMASTSAWSASVP